MGPEEAIWREAAVSHCAKSETASKANKHPSARARHGRFTLLPCLAFALKSLAAHLFHLLLI